MAGGALGGVFGAALRLFPWYHQKIEVEQFRSWFFDNDTVSSLVSIVLFVSLCIYLWVDSTRRVPIEE
jgi:hypothetical protein